MTDPKESRIWLCDLTYTQQTISSDIMPAAVGHIAAYTKEYIVSNTEISIFKFPEKLSEALENRLPPQVIGFSNYIWNKNLCYSFAQLIKKKFSETVIIFGGPNYPTNTPEQEKFLRDHSAIDYYIIKEGEIAFAKLVEALIKIDFDTTKLPDDLPSIHYIDRADKFYMSDAEERITDMSLIPSPYINGFMDEFFDGRLLPIIQTNRGCPFRCTFCVEGMQYYSRVAKTKDNKIQRELQYIAEKMVELRDQNNGRTDLHIADSNFGMYKEDMEVCEYIAELQNKYNYPEYISVATGKNHKERVLAAAKLVNGALRLSGAVQSLDESVLKNIERDNINEKEILELALEASEIGANSYSEIIMALPGDTRNAHFNTIKTIVEADFNNICLYQLMLLPGTDLASKESKEKWKMKTRFRALPRCYGYYDCLGEEINSVEIEEICVSNDSLTYADYVDCRRYHLIINVFYNDGVFKEVLRLIKQLGLSKAEWLERIYHNRNNNEFELFVQKFIKETETELWEDYGKIYDFTHERDNIKKYISGEFGANLIFKYRSIALIDHVNELADVAIKVLCEMFAEHKKEFAIELGEELVLFSKLRMSNIFDNLDVVHSATFSYAVDKYSNDVTPENIESYKLNTPEEYSFELSDQQKKTILNYISVYGDTIAGLSRILTKVYMRRLFRDPKYSSIKNNNKNSLEYILGDSQLTGLNEFS